MNDIENDETVKMNEDNKVDINEELDYEEEEEEDKEVNIKVNSEDGELKSDSDDNGELVSLIFMKSFFFF
jgi:hypothetical protein